MQRFASIVFAILMLAHALVPALPFFLCTEDDGSRLRGSTPCCPQEGTQPDTKYPILEHARCCELTMPVIVDAQPPVRQDHTELVVAQAAFLTVALPAPLTPERLSLLGLSHGPPLLRGPPLPLRSILRI
jgi:hypothetical protein